MKRFSLLIAALIIAASPAFATFHLMQIEQIIGGVNGDTSAQAIQLRGRAAGQDLVSQGKLVVFDATGSNPITLDLTSNVANGVLGDRILIATPNFASHTTPAAVPNFMFTSLIPASYLAAGSLCWESDTGMILWRVSWGGASYTGPTNGQITNDADGQFGPAWPTALPSGNLTSLQFKNAANALSTNNTNDYRVSASPAVFVNNARTSFTLIGGGGGGPTVTIAATDASAAEVGNNPGQFTVTRSPVSASLLVVHYTAGGSATSGIDYTALTGSVTIPANMTSVVIPVTPVNDTVAECTETVIATLSPDAAYTVGNPSSATVSIADDELPTVTLTTLDPNAAEVPVTNTGRFQVRRTGCTNSTLAVTYMVGGTATPATDYQRLSGVVTVAVNRATANITVRPINDTVPEGVETITIQLLPGANYILGTGVTGTVNITSNE